MKYWGWWCFKILLKMAQISVNQRHSHTLRKGEIRPRTLIGMPGRQDRQQAIARLRLDNAAQGINLVQQAF